MERKRNDDVVATIIACTMSNVMIMTIMNVVQMITIDVVIIMTMTMTTTTTIYYGRIKAVFLMNRRIERMAMDNAIHNSSRDMHEKAIYRIVAMIRDTTTIIMGMMEEGTFVQINGIVVLVAVRNHCSRPPAFGKVMSRTAEQQEEDCGTKNRRVVVGTTPWIYDECDCNSWFRRTFLVTRSNT
jgi:hypothetical protein